MDSEFLWIAVVLVYFLFQILGRKRKAAPPPKKTTTRPSAPPANAELDEALRDIRRALGWPEEEKTGVAVPQEAPRRPPITAKVEPRRHEHATPVKPAAAKTRRQDQVQKPREISKIVSRLHNTESLREDFIIKELLDRPLALRRRR